jgi:hypothetical protein
MIVAVRGGSPDGRYGRGARRWLPTVQERIGLLPRGGSSGYWAGRCRTKMSSSCARAMSRCTSATSRPFMALSRERLDPEFVFYSVWGGRVFRGLQGTRDWMLGHSRGLGELRPEGGGDRRPGGERSRRGAHSGAWRGQRRAGIPRTRGRLDIRWRQGAASTVIRIQSRSPRDRRAAEVDEPRLRAPPTSPSRQAQAAIARRTG